MYDEIAGAVLAIASVLVWIVGVAVWVLVRGREDETTPQFTHDCAPCPEDPSAGCVFLGRYVATVTRVTGPVDRPCDLWFCPSEPCLIARFSSEGSDYYSANPNDQQNHPALIECHKRAQVWRSSQFRKSDFTLKG